MPGRSYSGGAYRYGFNGQEKSEEVKGQGNSYTAEFWEYDPRTRTRWNLDPKPRVGVSDYSTFDGNPISNSDPNGDCPNCITAGIGAFVGGIIGGAIEAGTQLYKDGKVSNWKAVGGAAAQGAVTGAVAGFTGGTSLAAAGLSKTTALVVTATASGIANGVGGAVNNAVQGKQITVKSVAVDVAVGAAFGIGGIGLNKVVSSLANSKITQKSVAAKLANYLLNKEHPVGGSKADWFEKSLGYTKDNIDELAKQIKFDPKKAVFQKNNGYADLYQQVIPIKGANGRTIEVPFNWAINNGETAPKLVGAIPTKPTK